MSSEASGFPTGYRAVPTDGFPAVAREGDTRASPQPPSPEASAVVRRARLRSEGCCGVALSGTREGDPCR